MLTTTQAKDLSQLIEAYTLDFAYHATVSQVGTPEEISDAAAMARVTKAKLDHMLADLTLKRVEKRS